MVKKWIGQKCFSAVHTRNLVYNTCWEDPRLDREALTLSPDDSVMVITSAGCNALDYALQGPNAVYAVDMNPLQNALLELKKVSLKNLDYADFFRVFGEGCHPEWQSIYNDSLRSELPEEYQRIWDKRSKFFDGRSRRRRSFYFRGTSGFFAWLINRYIDRAKGLREAVEEVLQAETVEEQAEIYQRNNVSKRLFTKPLRWALRRDTTMAMLGVPRSQRLQLDRQYPGGIGQFIQDSIEAVFMELPLKDNYFWRVYLTGQYTQNCCPEYLTEPGHAKLSNGLADRVSSHSNTVEGFLRSHDGQVSRFVLLDHMDWLYENYPDLLASEWQSIVDRASSEARVLWRSAALNVDFVDPLMVKANGKQVRLGEMLNYQQSLAERLHKNDRVHTYGSFYIADLVDVAA